MLLEKDLNVIYLENKGMTFSDKSEQCTQRR